MLGADHPHLEKVRALLQAAEAAPAGVFTSDLRLPLGLELVLYGDTDTPSDATNYLGGVGNVLEAKARRGALERLGVLATVALFANDRQIQEAHYWREGAEAPH